MPRRTGFDVLEWLAAHPELSLPAIVLSSSSHESDIEKAKHLGALEYYVKPHRFSELVKLAQELHSRWLEATPVA